MYTINNIGDILDAWEEMNISHQINKYNEEYRIVNFKSTISKTYWRKARIRGNNYDDKSEKRGDN